MTARCAWAALLGALLAAQAGCSLVIDDQCRPEQDICPPGTRCDEGECRPVGPGEWVAIRAGTFGMGSPTSEVGRDVELETRHTVTLTRDFAILSTEVTQAQFDAMLNYNPASFGPDGEVECGPDCPVESITWFEALAYCNALSDAEDLPRCFSCSGEGASTVCSPVEDYASPYECPGYRLPTEAEWEYAARAGEPGATYNGELTEEQLTFDGPNPVLDPIAWWSANTNWPPAHPVAELRPNAWGLFDVLGNVAEWTQDTFEWGDYGPDDATDPFFGERTSSAVVRGGAWGSMPAECRFAWRDFDSPDTAEGFLGFRPVRTLE